nr:hypothetical protein [Tanacetum cinerariifolium]
MPIISNEPPDPPFDELCDLTKVTSAEDMCIALFNDTKVKVMKVKHRKPLRGGKVSTTGFVGTGSVLRRLRSAKSSGKARDRNEDSSVIIEVVNVCDIPICAINNVFDINELSNDGSFINSPLDNSSLNDLGSHVTKSCGLQTSSDHTGMGDVSNTVCGHNSSKGGIAGAKTGNVNDRDMAGSGTLNEHTSMEDIVNTGGVYSSSQDGIASYKVGRGFVFGKQENSKGILNPHNMDGDKSFGYSMLLNQFSADVDRFAKKLKQGSEEIALKMEYVPNSVCKLENGNRHISFSAEELEKTEPSSIPIWVCVYNIPMELCNDSGIGKIMSGVGKPLLMHKMTRERCLKKAGKMDFARVLVEVSAEDNLPNGLEIEYLPLGNKPVRPRTDEEIAAKTLKDVLNVGKSNVMDKGKSVTDDDGFTVQKSNSNAGNVKSSGNFNNTSKSSVQNEKKESIVDKPILASVFNHNYRPKGENVEDLGDINVNENFESKVWLDLKEEVDILLEAGIYPSKQVRLDWSIHQMDYFYKNCHKFHLDPYCEDDKGDVDSDDEGIAVDIKPEVDGAWIASLTRIRRSLWKSLSIHKNFVKDMPWTILGDFNACLDPAERSTGGSKFTMVMHDFRNCVEEIEVEDIAMTVMPKISNAKPKPFKFQNYLTAKDDFIPVVRNVWNSEIDGFSMFSLVSKLKLLKKPLRKLNFEQGNLFENVVRLKAELAGVQSSLSDDPHNKALREEELRVLKAYRAALKDEELFLRQKANVKWLRAGDSNSSYFHNVVKGQSSEVLPFSEPDSLFMKKLPAAEALKLVRIVSNEEIKLALFDIDGNKAPGPDEINATIISLVPKVAAPSKVSDYRPIACCNVIYKIISKVICNKLKGVLGFLVDENQSAFISSRQISDNIMLSQELIRNNHRNRGPAKCSFKINIEKAYDSMEWVFLSSSLKHFGFPELMVKWIMNCIKSTSFTVNVNGDHTGFFKGKRGLRQGDPLSPYLFTLFMEVFNLVLRREIDKNLAFRYHWQCKEIKLTHLCFVDDLLLFCNGDSCSVAVLKKVISTFGGLSGLLPNFAKSTVFFANVREVSRLRIIDIMPFCVGSLPVRYLGVPLISKRLYVKDYHLLIDKARKRLLDWKNKSLSFAGRLQLIMSVLSLMQVYWASIFILPSAIANDIERLIRYFLWNYVVFKRGKACVNWNSVCKPKVKGGLGIKSLDSWNKALMSKHIWNIITQKESLWVRWINTYRLKGRIFGMSRIREVANVIRNGAWEWPSSISNSFDALFVIPPPVLVHDKFDVVRWKSRNGKKLEVFSE